MVETAAAVEMAALPATADPTLVEATPLATVATAALLAAVAHSGSSSGNGRNDGKGSNVVMAAPTTVVDFTLVAAAAAAETVDLLAAVDPPATVDTFEHYARITTLVTGTRREDISCLIFFFQRTFTFSILSFYKFNTSL
ncbi:hypothetical protein FRB94_004636 [Tulasnella sp. JGI-2019a]|nr:hypothetical protein FRB94_004636 [Tulasnella sp. JGI-2019a]